MLGKCSGDDRIDDEMVDNGGEISEAAEQSIDEGVDEQEETLVELVLKLLLTVAEMGVCMALNWFV